ncbi:hypothetical protein CUR178_00007 [Leishmania enriettii]|uniref:SAP domain-containing protein n=1 Tax=Leishmania enriettii TaxID=5663 RepID=A0A836KH21_LEIEN|nr:hypothetical protein CUR178_00007 [Leishmania enriettii]
MDSVKRRLVYVADESEVLLDELSGTPPARPSRLTRLLVPLSPPTSARESPYSASPLPRPIGTKAQTSSSLTADTALLVSYDGFLLTDGNGRFSTPRDATQAACIRDALKTCRAFLKGFLDAARAQSASTESSGSGISSSTYMEEEDSDLEVSSSEDSPAPRRRAAKTSKASQSHGPPRSPSHMTVAELKELLRDHGLSVSGSKTCLLKRAQTLQRGHESEHVIDTPPVNSHKSGEMLRRSLSDCTSLNSGVSLPLPPLSPPSLKMLSPNSHTSEDKNSGIWGALVHAGSRLFRGGGRASWGFHTRSPEDSDDASLSKRRRLDT